MRKLSILAIAMSCLVSLAATPDQPKPRLAGYSVAASQKQREWEEKFRALPAPENLRNYMQRLTAQPHHVGSPYDKDNAEWILARFKEWGWDAHIESFDVLFPTPKTRVVELLMPPTICAGICPDQKTFTAKLEEPLVPN